jgi:hypothetical protein
MVVAAVAGTAHVEPEPCQDQRAIPEMNYQSLVFCRNKIHHDLSHSRVTIVHHEPTDGRTDGRTDGAGDVGE